MNSQQDPTTQNQSNTDHLTKEIIWRRNAPYLYQLLYVSELDWPSLTIDWVSAYKSTNNHISEDI